MTEMGAGLVREFCSVKVRSPLSTERACVWTLGGLLTDEQFDRFLKEPETTLRPFVINGGTVEFDMPSLIIRALKA